MTCVTLHATRCAICDTEGNATEIYPTNFEPAAFSPEVFSARRLPDRIHYRMVRCNTCGLLRSDPVADPTAIARLYQESHFDYGREAENLARTYGAYLERLDRHRTSKDSILEIGCGNGFFLKKAREQGWQQVRGVEPSRAAVEAASAEIRPSIICAMMQSGLFPDQSFDAICLFQVLDHILDPTSLLKQCFQILKPGGLILCLNHNVDALSSKLMRERSPIVDIEHSYLYSPITITRLFQRFGFEVRETGSVTNRYSLSYLAQLAPVPTRVKQHVLALLDRIGLGRVPLRIPLGNLYMIAQKPSIC
jgi:SAM-dependent methyltransferase